MKPPIPLKDLLRLYNVEKLPVTEIATRLNVTRQGVYYTLWRHKVKARPRTCIRKQRSSRFSREKLFDLYWKQGLSLAKVGERLDVSAATVFEEMARHNIPRRPVGRHQPEPAKHRLSYE